MQHTVIGFFKEPSDAQKAVSQLESKGIPRQNLDVTRGEYLDATADLDGRNTNKFTDFFNKLFGHDSNDAKLYSTVGQSNVTMVTVHATSEDLAEDAADILDDCGAIDVDEHDSRSADTTITGNRNVSAPSQDNYTTQQDRARESNMRRSRIINRSVDDEFRLRDGV